MEIIGDVHQGIGDSEHSKAMTSHRGKNTTYSKVAQRFFWHKMSADINENVKSCEQCQRQGDLKSPKVELKSMPVPSSVLKQVWVDICNLLEVDRYRKIIVLIDYFKMVGSETDQGQISFNYRSIFGQYDVPSWVLWNPNQRPRSEFVNEVCKQLHELTGVEQRVTPTYHSQGNGLVERQNRTIKNSLVKFLEDNPEIRPQIIEGTFLLIVLVDILPQSTLHSCWCTTAS